MPTTMAKQGNGLHPQAEPSQTAMDLPVTPSSVSGGSGEKLGRTPLLRAEKSEAQRAGQERFRTLTSSYYRGAQGIIMVYDVTRRETFTNLSEIWAKEIDLYSTNQDCIRMLVGNKVDKEGERAVTKKEGIDFGREYGCLFIECSAKTRVNVQQCFEELILKILDTPALLAEGSKAIKKNIFKEKPPQPIDSSSSCC
nr:ras-related protein RABC1-like [Ipomoea batatas]